MNEQLPDGWVEVELGDIANFVYGKGLLTKELTQEGFPVFGANGIIGFYDSYLYEDEKIIISCRGAASGVLHKTARNAYVTSNSIIIDEIGSGLVDINYLKYAIESRDRSSIITGSAQPQITIDNLKNFKIPLVPFAEQARIVTALDGLLGRVRTAQEQLATVPKLLKRFRQGVLSAAVSAKLTEGWREENTDVESATELLKRMQKERIENYEYRLKNYKSLNLKKPKSPINLNKYNESYDFPENWDVVMPEHLISTDEYSLGIGPFGSDLKVSDYTNDGVPLIFVRHIKANNFSGLKPQFISTEKAKSLIAHSVKPLDLLVTKMGEPPGDCELYPSDKPIAIITADCLKFRVWANFYERQFYKYCINSFFIKDQLGLITQGVAQQKISLERFKTLHFPVPPLAEQQEIVRRVSGLLAWVDKLEDNYREAKRQLDAMPAAILAKAFAGELTEQNPADEPASVLLERIRAERLAEQQRPKEKKKPTADKIPKRRKTMAEQLRSIKEILTNTNTPISAHTVWQQSVYKDNIEGFYAALKQLVDVDGSVVDVKEGEQTYLKLADAD